MENHQEKQEIFDRYAVQQGYESFFEIIHDYIYLNNPNEIINHVFSVCDLVQQEQRKRIAERFKTLAYSDQVGDIFVGDFEKMEDSITNPENIIK